VTFEESDLGLIASTEEISVETRSKSGEVHQTIVWPVVRDGVVYLRSYKGPNGRWYREALADPAIALRLDDRRWSARAIPATDATSVESTFGSVQPPDRASDRLRSELTPVLNDVVDAISGMRIAARRHEWASLLARSRALPELGRSLRHFEDLPA
jgi:hypothetical protein